MPDGGSGTWGGPARSSSTGPISPAHGRLANAARQAAQLPWFVRNVALKVFLTVGGRHLLERLGRRAPEWPY